MLHHYGQNSFQAAMNMTNPAQMASIMSQSGMSAVDPQQQNTTPQPSLSNHNLAGQQATQRAPQVTLHKYWDMVKNSVKNQSMPQSATASINGDMAKAQRPDLNARELETGVESFKRTQDWVMSTQYHQKQMPQAMPQKGPSGTHPGTYHDCDLTLSFDLDLDFSEKADPANEAIQRGSNQQPMWSGFHAEQVGLKPQSLM